MLKILLLAYTVTFAGVQNKKNQLREFMNFKNNKFRKTTNHISTRRLSFEKYLERILMQWDSFKSNFLSNFNLNDDPTENDTDRKPSREKRLVNAFK